MTNLPLIRATDPGIYQVCAVANTDYVLTVPAHALGLVLWFETSAADATLIGGRIGFDQAATIVTGVTNADAVLGYHPAMPVEYTMAGYSQQGETYRNRDHYVHVACATAGAVAKGYWLFSIDAAA